MEAVEGSIWDGSDSAIDAALPFATITDRLACWRSVSYSGISL